MRKARVETKPRKVYLKCANGHLTRDKAWLEQKYFVENISIAKIAKLIPCDYGTIHKAFKRLGIAFKPKHVTYGDINLNPAKGEKNGNAKLTAYQVSKIRQMSYFDKTSNEELSKLFNISRRQIYKILAGINWQE